MIAKSRGRRHGVAPCKPRRRWTARVTVVAGERAADRHPAATPDITASRRVATMRRLCEAYHYNVSAICLVLVHSIT